MGTRTGHCNYCRGYRLMIVRTDRYPDGRVTRRLVCPACDTAKPFGICCPKCGDVRFAQLYTRHRPDGSTVRVKGCRGCKHRIRTREKVESPAA